MYKFVTLIILASFFIAGCSGVDVYTFKKERVDQGIQGNEGYIMGKKLETAGDLSNRKRTIIGVDVDMEEFGIRTSGGEETVSVTPAKEAVKETVVETKKKSEDWIK